MESWMITYKTGNTYNSFDTSANGLLDAIQLAIEGGIDIRSIVEIDRYDNGR